MNRKKPRKKPPEPSLAASIEAASQTKRRRRVMMALRVTPELHDEILRRVEATGRSITQEMELLLEQALFTERAIGAGGGLAWNIAHDTMVRLIRAVIERERQTGKVAPIEPLYDPETYRLAMTNAIEGLAAHWPGHPSITEIDDAINDARARIARKWKERDQ
jgi:hypothetical protein